MPHRSLTGLFALTLSCWLWPLLHSLGIELIEASGYALKLGAYLLNLLAMAASIVLAVPLSCSLYLALRHQHAPLKPARIVRLACGSSIGTSSLIIGLCVWMNMFCLVGACPRPN